VPIHLQLFSGQNANMHMSEAMLAAFEATGAVQYLDRAHLLAHARNLFDTALEKSWDEQRGGMHYTSSPDGRILDTDRYYWVLSETFAAALLALRTGEPRYWVWYDRVWEYSDQHFIDHDYGGWYRVLNVDGQKYDDLKSLAAKTDYHPLLASYEVLQALTHAGQ
jgi:mannose/cellobiose epimerase-like protein (N-acyl-D-glucosamine 2-epimerase family)